MWWKKPAAALFLGWRKNERREWQSAMEELPSPSLPTEPKETYDRLGMMLEVPYLQCTWATLLYLAFFQPVLIPKQLQQTLLLFPIALAVTVFCYFMGVFYAALVCTCLLICLVKVLRGIKMQTEIGAFSFSEKRDCISVSACTRKANRKTDTFCVFRGGGGKRVNLLLWLQ